jgi:hypothetical protein
MLEFDRYELKFVFERYSIGEPGWRSRYSDWLRAGQPRGRSSSPGEGKNFHFSMSSRPTLRPTQPPIQRAPGLFPRG